MKTKTFLVLCLFLSFSLAQLSAQSDKGSNGITKTFVNKINDFGYWAPVYCDGVLVDELWGNIKVQYLTHVENNSLKWEILIWKGELTGWYGEVFQIHESDMIGIPDPGVYTYHLNLVGNMGSHYINSGILNMADWSIVIDKAVCPDNKK